MARKQLAPKPPVTLPDPTPDTPALPDPTVLPDKPENIEMPKPSFIENIASRPLVEVRSFLSALFWFIGLILAQFFGIDNANLNNWIGPDSILQVSELWSFLMFIITTYFIKNRKPGAVEGIVTSPEMMTVTKMTMTQVPRAEVKADAKAAQNK
jgi:hypothetical protein